MKESTIHVSMNKYFHGVQISRAMSYREDTQVMQAV